MEIKAKINIDCGQYDSNEIMKKTTKIIEELEKEHNGNCTLLEIVFNYNY